MIHSFIKRHKKLSITLVVILALIVTYPVWPSFVRCEIVRLKMAAYLQFEEIIHSDSDKDYIKKDSYGVEACYFENSQTLNTLKKMAFSSRIEDAANAALSTWPTPFYYVGKTEVGGNGWLVYHELFHFYILYPGEQNTRYLLSYVDQIAINGEMDGMG